MPQVQGVSVVNAELTMVSTQPIPSHHSLITQEISNRLLVFSAASAGGGGDGHDVPAEWGGCGAGKQQRNANVTRGVVRHI